MKTAEADSRVALREDAVLQPLLARMPANVQESFSEEQLAYLKLALGARRWGAMRSTGVAR